MAHSNILGVLGVLIITLSIRSGNGYYDPANFPERFKVLANEIHEICADITSVTDNQIDGMRHGIFPEDDLLKVG
ncbi:hypothetical protein JTB14_025253 [Gonioctena quinquepunctata]|nr:hypothetical protein JTB14_025253 [Gonioctena quinquepunctata]